MGTTTTILVILTVILLVGVLAFRRFKAALPVSGLELQSMIATMAEGAVGEAKQQNVSLDYSADSVQHIEAILAKFHERYRSGEMAHADVNRQAMRYGSYVGEVIRRMKGGIWARDHEQAGPHTYPLSYGEHQSFPIMWCGKRMVNGPEDNVWHKFQIIVLEDAAAPGGEPAAE